MSNPTEEDWKRISKMVDMIYSRPDAEPFREPVPWKSLGLTDYPAIIKQPMDLGTIKNKIKKHTYKTLYQVHEDIRLVWSNCMTYNADGSDFYKLAELLKRKWDEKYKRLLNDIGTGSGSNTITTTPTTSLGGSGGGALAAPGTNLDTITSGGIDINNNTNTNNSSSKSSLQDKRNFAKLLYQITKEELGKVLVDVETRHPAALKRNATEDEVILNIDEIPQPLLQDLYTYVSSVKGQKKKPPSSSTKGNVNGSNKKAKTSIS